MADKESGSRMGAGRDASLNKAQQGASDPESMSCPPAYQGYDDSCSLGLAREDQASTIPRRYAGRHSEGARITASRAVHGG